MKETVSMLIMTVLLMVHEQSDVADMFKKNIHKRNISQTDCLSQADTEKILGLPALLKENSSGKKGSIIQYRCTYTSTFKDDEEGESSNLYYMFELYDDATLAHRSFADILQSNEGVPGQKKMDDLGDEAWVFTDETNYYLLMARKKNKMIRIKVNKVTSKTSRQELLNVAKGLVSKMD